MTEYKENGEDKESKDLSPDNKFSTTFGFSHGVENATGQGGVLVRKAPKLQGPYRRNNNNDLVAKKEKQM